MLVGAVDVGADRPVKLVLVVEVRLNPHDALMRAAEINPAVAPLKRSASS